MSLPPLLTLLCLGVVAAYPGEAMAQVVTAPTQTPAPASTAVTATTTSTVPSTAATNAPAPVSATAIVVGEVPVGRIQGVIVDDAMGDTLIDAQVTVEGHGASAVTDLDGKYQIDLPPGDYTLKVVNPPYKMRRLKGVNVKAGHATVVDLTMSAQDDAVETVAVVADPDRTRANIQLLIRRKAPAVSDILSSEEMSKTSDTTAGEAVRRATGASVIGGKYIYVRGLGERYSYSMLNDSRLPSPEPDKQVVPLDLFPTGILSNVTIIKTATPDLPGDFAGGAVLLETKQFPDKRVLQLTASVGANSFTTFRNMRSYRGGAYDMLGVDDGTRAFPNSVPLDIRLFRGVKLGNHELGKRDMAVIGREFNNDFELTSQRALPNQSYSAAYGDTVDVADRALGFLGSLSYGNSFQRVKEVQRVFALKSGEGGKAVLEPNTDFTGERGTLGVQWSGLTDLSYKLSRRQKVALTSLYTLTSENEARRLEGRDKNQGSDIVYTRQYYLSRSLWFNQLRGEHQFEPVAVEWRASYSEAVRKEPDLRELTRSKGPEGGLLWVAKSSSGGHFFSELLEPAISAGTDFTLPFEQWNGLASNVKAGALETRRNRRFDVRRFRFTPEEGGDPRLYEFTPNDLFGDASIGTNVRFEEASRSTDNYRAEQNIHAAYLMTDLSLAAQLRLVTGLRLEQSVQQVVTEDPFNAKVKPVKAELNDTDFLPSANIIYALNETSNLRASYSRNVARPELRELAPFSFADFYGGLEVYGNPKLKRTSIQSFDGRYEVFFAPGEVLSASLFYKRFQDPIEQIIVPGSTLAKSYANASRATNFGAEFEARQAFGFIGAVFAPFYGSSNVTLVRSRVDIGKEQRGAQTSKSRPLQGQSDYLANVALGFQSDSGTSAQTTYNVFGKRIDQVGAFGMPDVYEMPRHTLDVTVQRKIDENWELRLYVENLLDQATRYKQGDFLVERSYKGVNFGAGVSFKL